MEEAFGSPGRVRVLRYVALSARAEHTLSDIAAAIGLGFSSTRVAVHALADQGFLDLRGIGNVSLVSLPKGGIGKIIQRMVRLEREVEQQWRANVAALAPPKASVVLFGSGARDDQTPASDLDVLVVAASKKSAEAAADKVGAAAALVGPLRLRALSLSANDLRSKRKTPWIQAVLREGILLAGPDLRTWL